MISAIITLLGVLGQWGLGIGLACALLGTLRSRKGRVSNLSEICLSEVLGLGLLLGIATTSYVSFVWSSLGGRLGSSLSWTLTAGGLVLAVVAWRKKPSFFGKTGLWDATCASLITGLFFASLLQTLLTPQRLWDERAIFGIKGVALFEDASVASTDLAHPDFVQGHPRYPLLLPLAEQHLYALLGHVDDRWAKVIPPVLYLGLVLTFAGVLSRNIVSSQAWLFAVLVATTPVLLSANYGILCVQADSPVACFHGAAMLYWWDAVRSDVRDRGLSVLIASSLMAATVFTKDEGIALVLIDISLFTTILVFQCFSPLAVSQREEDKPLQLARVFRVFALIIIPLALLAPWFVHRSHLPRVGEMDYFGRMSLETLRAGLTTLAWSVPHILHRMFVEVLAWGAQWWLMLVSFLSRPRRGVTLPQLLLLGDVFGSIAALLVAGMLAPVIVNDHLGGASQRFLLQLAPVAILFAAGQWGTFEAREEASRGIIS